MRSCYKAECLEHLGIITRKTSLLLQEHVKKKKEQQHNNSNDNNNTYWARPASVLST